MAFYLVARFLALAMIRIAFRRCLNHSSRFQRRFLATVVDESPSGIAPKPSDELSGELRTFRTQEGALRGHLEIPVKKNHGLYAFFRRVPDEDSLDKYKYVSYEAYHDRIHGSGKTIFSCSSSDADFISQVVHGKQANCDERVSAICIFYGISAGES